jgi:hypothetical protein
MAAIIEPLRKVGLDMLPLCIVPGRERLADAGNAMTEANIPMPSAGIAKLRKPPVFSGF